MHYIILHILLILASQVKPRSTDNYDNLVCAEIPDSTKEPDLYKIVTKCMLHGPCHLLPNSPCLNENQICTKGNF